MPPLVRNPGGSTRVNKAVLNEGCDTRVAHKGRQQVVLIVAYVLVISGQPFLVLRVVACLHRDIYRVRYLFIYGHID